MNSNEKLQKLFSKHIESGLPIQTDEGDWDINIHQNNKIEHLSGAVIIANNECGDFLYVKSQNCEENLLKIPVYVFWHEDQTSHKLVSNIHLLVNPPPPAPSQYPLVFYHGGQIEVKLGDEIRARDFIFRKNGRVSYIPGVSKKHREFERDGMAWIGISFSSGSIGGGYIDPSNNWVVKSVHFISRSDKPIHEIEPNEDLDK